MAPLILALTNPNPTERLPPTQFISFVFNKPRVILMNPDSVRETLMASDKDYIRPPALLPYVRRLFGKSVLAASGEAWQRQHRLLYKAPCPLPSLTAWPPQNLFTYMD